MDGMVRRLAPCQAAQQLLAAVELVVQEHSSTRPGRLALSDPTCDYLAVVADRGREPPDAMRESSEVQHSLVEVVVDHLTRSAAPATGDSPEVGDVATAAAVFEELLQRFLSVAAREPSSPTEAPDQHTVLLLLLASVSERLGPTVLLSGDGQGLSLLRLLGRLLNHHAEWSAAAVASVRAGEEPVEAVQERGAESWGVLSVVLALVSAVLHLGQSDVQGDRQAALREWTVPLAALSEALDELGRAAGSRLDDESGTDLGELAAHTHELHVGLLAQQQPTTEPAPPLPPQVVATSLADSNDAVVDEAVSAAGQDLCSTEPALRARGVALVSDTLRRLAAAAGTRAGDAAEGQEPLRSPLIQVVGEVEPWASPLSVNTLGRLLGTLLAMLEDRESYVYLGAVHALQGLLEMPPTAARRLHCELLVRLFALEPLDVGPRWASTAGAALAEHVRTALTLQRSVRGREASPATSDCAHGCVVALTAAQRLPLGEALVLAVRRSGDAAGFYSDLFLPALVRGAAPPPLQQSQPPPNPASDCAAAHGERLALAALRASCFSGLAELGRTLGWGVAGAPMIDLGDLCVRTLRHERSAQDLHAATAWRGHALSARRGAALLARSLLEGSGLELLHARPEVLRDLYRVLRSIHAGPGAAAAGSTAESDPVVREQAAWALAAIDELMFDELEGRARVS